jgi:hypothetical protein
VLSVKGHTSLVESPLLQRIPSSVPSAHFWQFPIQALPRSWEDLPSEIQACFKIHNAKEKHENGTDYNKVGM